jgi:hypothetical protein
LAQHIGRGGDHRSPQRTGSILRRLGISHRQSSKWQRMAALPEGAFEALAKRARDERRELTQAAVLRAARPAGVEAGPA